MAIYIGVFAGPEKLAASDTAYPFPDGFEQKVNSKIYFFSSLE
jgi:hypothetical protein